MAKFLIILLLCCTDIAGEKPNEIDNNSTTDTNIILSV